MKIETFLKLFSTKRKDEEKEKAVLDIIKNDHVSFVDKVDRTKLIAKQSYYTKKKMPDGVEREIFEQNSAAKYMLYSLTLVDLYTKLDIDFKKSVEQFEQLNGEVLDIIFRMIDDRERTEFQMLLDFACDDIMVNNYEPHAFIREQIDRFGNLFGAVIAPALENLDVGKIQEVMTEFSKA